MIQWFEPALWPFPVFPEYNDKKLKKKKKSFKHVIYILINFDKYNTINLKWTIE